MAQQQRIGRGGGDFPGQDNQNQQTPRPWPPEIAMEALFSLPPNLQGTLIDLVKGSLASAFPHGDVRATGEGGAERIGIWVEKAGSGLASQDRDLGLKQVNVANSITATGTRFAVRIMASAIQAMVTEVWKHTPRQLNDTTLTPDSQGLVWLNSFDWDLVGPDEIKSTVRGYIGGPHPDIPFTVTTKDTLRVAGGHLRVTSKTHVDIDQGFAAFISGLVSAVSGIPFPIVYGNLAPSASAPDGGETSIGSAVAALMPSEILIPGTTEKITFAYSQASVKSGDHVMAGGTLLPGPRDPKVVIEGGPEFSVAADIESTAMIIVSARTMDLRGPLTVEWSVSPAGEIASPHKLRTKIEIPIQGHVAGTSLTATVTLHVTDADGASAHASAEVHIHITRFDGTDPICVRKPWLPQCSQQGQARPASR